jgi:hypothetical protein
MLNNEFTFGTFLAFRSNSIKDSCVLIDCKIYFQHHLDFIFFTCIETARANSHYHAFLIHHRQRNDVFGSVRSKLEYASVAWNSVTVTDSKLSAYKEES